MPDSTCDRRHKDLDLGCMENAKLTHIDLLVEHYQKNHKGLTPLYVVLAPDEGKEIREVIRKNNNYPTDFVITKYKGLSIAENPAQLPGNMYVSNELPETGS